MDEPAGVNEIDVLAAVALRVAIECGKAAAFYTEESGRQTAGKRDWVQFP